MNNINITYVTPNQNEATTRIEFTAKFQGTNDSVSGTINVNNSDLTKAYQQAVPTDPYWGHKHLVAVKLAEQFSQVSEEV